MLREGMSLTKTRAGLETVLQVLPELPSADARQVRPLPQMGSLALYSVKGAEAWGPELNLLIVVSQLPCLGSGLYPVA